MLSNGFNFLLKFSSRPAKIKDLNTSAEADIKISDSNYFRKLEGVEETTIAGKEYVISKEVLDLASWGVPKRGQRIFNDDTGKYDSIGKVIPMRILGIVRGYRVRIE